jgi:hypothetical protein
MSQSGQHRATANEEDVAVGRARLGGFCAGMAVVLLVVCAAHLWLWTF